MRVADPSWLNLVFRPSPEEWRQQLPRLLAFLTVSVAVTVISEFGVWTPAVTPLPFTLVALPLGVYLAFRANRAHDRYWEARIQWGNLVNATRSFARQFNHLIVPTDPENNAEADALRHQGVRRVIAFAYALRSSLSGAPSPSGVAVPGEPDLVSAGERNIPQAILRNVTPLLHDAMRRGWLHPVHLPDIEVAVTRMTDVQGACERIRNTPLPVPLTTLSHRLVVLYCVGLPFGLVEQFGWMTPVISVFITYAFVGLDSVVEQIESPFAPGPNQLPLLTMCRTIETNLLQTLGDSAVPEVPPVVDGVVP